MKRKKEKYQVVKDVLKLMRKESREAEIKAHGKPINHSTKETSPKAYKRDKKDYRSEID